MALERRLSHLQEIAPDSAELQAAKAVVLVEYLKERVEKERERGQSSNEVASLTAKKLLQGGLAALQLGAGALGALCSALMISGQIESAYSLDLTTNIFMGVLSISIGVAGFWAFHSGRTVLNELLLGRGKERKIVDELLKKAPETIPQALAGQKGVTV